MTINIINADVFVEAERCGYMAHGCNMQGQMGAGVALHVGLRYPRSYESYKRHCDSIKDKPVVAGGYLLTAEENNKYVADSPPVRLFHLFTQVYPGRWARVEYIRAAVERMLEKATSDGIKEIAIPYLIGCGFGGLKEQDVLPAIEEIANKYPDIKLTICKLDKKY